MSDDAGRIGMFEYRSFGSDPAPQELMRYIYSNNIQSSNLELNENGEIISYEEYHPFGTTAYQATNASINAVAKRYRYTGKERDEESGLYYHGARYYIPWLARWSQCDPIGIGDGLNVYEYCSSNPISLHDPTGKWGESFKQMYSEAKQAVTNKAREIQKQVVAVKENISNKINEVKHNATKKIESAKAAINHKLAEVKAKTDQVVKEVKKEVKEAGNRVAAHREEIIKGVIVGAIVTVAIVASVATLGTTTGVSIALSAAAIKAITVAGVAVTAYSTVQSARGRDLMNNKISDKEAMHNFGFGIGAAAGGLISKPAVSAGTTLGKNIKGLVSSGEKVTEELVTLYRGVNSGAGEAYENALNGIVKPRGGFFGHSDAMLHNAGPNGTLNSSMTSWTTDVDVALNYAFRKSGEGVLLKIQVPKSATIVSPNTKSIQLFQNKSIFKSESEVLIKGTLKNINFDKVKM